MTRGTGPGAVTTATGRRWLVAVPWLVAAAVAIAALTLPRGDGPDTVPPVPTLAAAVHLDALHAARLALGTHGIAADGPAGTWVLDQVVGPVSSRPDGTAEVVVHATVIERTDGGWSAPRAVVALVPLTAGERPRVAGPATPAPLAP